MGDMMDPGVQAPARCAPLLPADAEDVVDVLADAFRDYPVMRHVLGVASADAKAVRQLVRLFVGNRVLRGHPMLGVRDPRGRLVGAATLTPPGEWPAPAEALALRERTWEVLGERARARYEAFAAAVTPLEPVGRWWHLNMLGVRRDAQGSGVARRLLEAVHALAAEDPDAEGVDLTTERAGNLRLYAHFGYRVVASTSVPPSLLSWTLCRPADAQPSLSRSSWR